MSLHWFEDSLKIEEIWLLSIGLSTLPVIIGSLIYTFVWLQCSVLLAWITDKRYEIGRLGLQTCPFLWSTESSL